jgi:asparagine synthase (glutamine-hydrolysing)
MCGIACIYGNNPKEEILLGILNKLKHRGDKNGEYKILERCILGTDRLAITDRERAVQPISNEDGSIFVVFNGEIYNHEQLRLQLKNHIFKTNSDTEILVHGYEEWGEGICNKLDGQFAFVVFEKKLTLFLPHEILLELNPFTIHTQTII